MLTQVRADAKITMRDQQTAIVISVILTALASILGLMFSLFISTGITRPVRRLLDGTRAVEAGRPVAMLLGRFIPRHWVLVVAAAGRQWQCYEPSSGEVRTVSVDAVRGSCLTGLGYPRPFVFVLPRASHSGSC